MKNNLTYVFPNFNFVDLTIYQFGMEQCEPMLSCGPAMHNHYLLHYIVSGKGTFSLINGEKYDLGPGQAFLICPNSVTLYCADKDDPWRYIWVEFDGLKASTFLLEANLTLKSPIYTPASNADNNLLSTYMHNLIEYHDESPLKLIGTLYYILDILIETSSKKNPSKFGSLAEFYTREAINYIEKNYDKDISVNDIANWCGLNRCYFGKIFKDTVLVTPQEFLIKYRMNKACDLLKNTDIPVGDIALHVGYENQLNFSRAFKNAFGISPREWRKLNQFVTKH